MVVEITFGSRDAARQIRENPKFKGFLADSDDARKRTIRLKDGTPKSALDEITGEAADSKSHTADKAGQAALSRKEREQIDFSRENVNVPKVRSIKAIAANEGVTDYLQFADLELTVDENRELLKQAAREEKNRRDLGREQTSDAMIDKRLAEANNRRKQEEEGRAKDFALIETDPEAQSFVQERSSFDIAFSRTDSGQLVGQGEDFDRLEKRHEKRSGRAQTLDEKKSAKITRDPIQWANNPNEYDYPGIDTVQPQQLHEERSERAQRQDEREIAPQAESKEQWALHPEQYDWHQVDRPVEYGPTMAESVPSTERNTQASEPMTAQLSKQDISLSPEEAFEGVATGSHQISATNEPFGLAGEQEADMAFIEAEEKRKQEKEQQPAVFEQFE